MNVSKILSLFLLLLYCDKVVATTLDASSLGVIGDSYSTGFDLSRIEINDVLNSKLEISQELLWPSAAEFDSPLSWMLKNFWIVLSRGALDQEEIAWPTHVAATHKVLNASYDGASFRSIRDQFYRIVQKTEQIDRLYIWFSVTEICSGNLQSSTLARVYEGELQKMFNDLDNSKNLKVKKIILLPPLNLGQLIHDEKILNKSVDGFHKEANCRSIKSTQEHTTKAKLLTYFCPNIFVQNDKAASAVATQVQSIRQTLRKLVNENQMNFSKKNIEIEYVENLESFVFKPEDLADDCLHLSKAGHLNLTKYLQ